MKVREIFQNYINEKIVLYGLSMETEKILGELGGDFKIEGLLDSFRESGELYGKPILSLQQVVRMQIKLIVVVARPGSCKAIAKRIREICLEHGIALLDIKGNDLLISNKVLYDFAHVNGGTKGELFKKADSADIVSFDLFDTLVTRKVLSYTDIFEIMAYRLQERGHRIPDFHSRRLHAEKELAKDGAPTLEMIYKILLDDLDDQVDISVEELAELEWEIDYSAMIPRTAVVEMFDSIVLSGKRVYIVTDTYYRRPQLEEILRKCGIEGYMDIIASCEYQTGKKQKLFPVFHRECGGGRILHIGDDIVSDIESAGKCGMETFRIYSGLDLLDELGALGLEEQMVSLADRVKSGLFTARLLNNPFQFENQERVLSLENAYDIGYILCAPMVCDFVLWFCEQVRQQEICNVWFAARDGYLLKKLYQMIDDSKTLYFLTSRIAAIRAGMEDLSDVRYVESMKFTGTLEENLQVRFGIYADRVESMDNDATGLMRYADAILKNAREQRKNYYRYIDTLQMREGDIAFFDFVAKGTTQMFLQKLMNTGAYSNYHLQGYYFLQLEPDSMADKGLDIESFYCATGGNENAVFDNYYILETILTSPHPMIIEFDGEGEPVYEKETRREQDIRCIMRVQEGIEDYFKDYLDMMPEGCRSVNKKLDEVILGLVCAISITDRDFRSLIVEDPFFNRMTEVSDLLPVRNLSNTEYQLKPGIIDIIARQLGVSRRDIIDIEILKKGMTNRSFLFSYMGTRYIMRVPGEGTDLLIDRKQEAEVYAAIEGRKLCDRPLYISPRNGCKITRYIEGVRCCDPNDLSDIELCMRKLRSFHEMKIKVDHEFDIFRMIDFYESLWEGKRSAYPDYKETKRNVLSLRPFIEQHISEKVLTHIDAVPDNFLFDPEKEDELSLQLTDWEYAGMQDPHVDIAMFCIYSFYDKHQIDRLIHIYFEGACPSDIQTKIYCYIAVCGLLWSNWCEYKRNLGVKFGEYSLRQYRYAKEYYWLAVERIKGEKGRNEL